MNEETVSPGTDNSSLLDDIFLATYAYICQAESALKKKQWDSAISTYQIALNETPHDVSLYLALAKAYEAKSRSVSSDESLLSAMQLYRKVIASDHDCSEAYEAGFSLAVKLDKLQDFLDDCQNVLKTEPDHEMARSTIRKIQALLILRTQPKIIRKSHPHRWTRWLMEWVLPSISALCVLGWFYFAFGESELENKKNISRTLLQSGGFLMAVYLGYKSIMHYRGTK